MFIQNLSKREKILVAACIIVAVIAIVYNLVIEPLMIRWKMLSNQIESKIALLMRDTRLLNMYKTLEEEHAKYHGFIDISANEEEELAETLGEIEKISQKSSSYIVNIKPRTTRSLGNYKEILFEVVAEGSMEELSQFLHAIETSRKYLRIRRFTMVPKSGSPEGLKATLLISKILVT